MKKKIIILNGQAASGKDTFVNFVKSYHPDTHNFSSIDYIRWLSETYLDVDTKTKDAKLRLFLSEFKRILADYNDLPFKQCVRAIESLKDGQALFLHIREVSEIAKIKDLYPETLLVFVQAGDIKVIGNDSDDKVNEIEYDVTIFNYGSLSDLSSTAKWFTKTYILD